MVWRSSVSKGHSKTHSLRTTIPEEVCHEVGISVGDLLDWSVLRKDGKKIIQVRRIDLT